MILIFQKLFKSKALSRVMALLLLGFGFYLVFNLVTEIFLGKTPLLGDHNDFLSYYSGAFLVLHNLASHLYDLAFVHKFQFTLIHKDVGAAGFLPYINPGFLAVFISPLALLSFFNARIVWFGFNLLLATIDILWILKRFNKRSKFLALILLLTTFPLYHTLVEGQLSILMLSGGLLALRFAEQKKLFLSGGATAVFWLKPQLAMILIVGLGVFKQWKITLGLILSFIVLTIICLPFVNLKTNLDYFFYLLGVLSAHLQIGGLILPPMWQGNITLMSNLNGFFASLFGIQTGLLVGSAVILSAGLLIVFALLKTKITKPGFENSDTKSILASLIAIGILVDPHLFAQDVVLFYLILPLLLAKFKNKLAGVILFCLLLDLVFIDQNLRIHLFTLVVYLTIVFQLFSKKILSLKRN